MRDILTLFNRPVHGPKRDTRRINIYEDSKLKWWADYFEVSTDRIKEAAQNVGTSLEELKKYFNKS